MGALNASTSSGVELMLPGPWGLCEPKRRQGLDPTMLGTWSHPDLWLDVTALQPPAPHLSTTLRPSTNSTLWNFLRLARPRALVGLLVPLGTFLICVF